MVAQAKRPTLSVVIATKNEASNIENCLTCLQFAEEIIVLDSGSNDGTAAMARKAGARVVHSDWPGFGLQKARMLKLATQQWVMVIDADERVTPALRNEIERALVQAATTDIHGFWLPRLSQFCGNFIRHGGWYPDHTLRLARRDQASFTPTLVHERMLVSGRTAKLESPMLHHSYPTVDSLLAKLDRYSSAGAADLYAAGKRSSLRSALGHGAWAFFRTYVLKRGFLDGRLGFMLAVYNAEASYYKHAKLMLMRASSGAQ